jgi:RimJ/RimL family protein N-acetyltransferase
VVAEAAADRRSTDVLRDVREDDLDVFFEQQRDPESMAMALMPAREREAFDAHWRRILADDSLIARVIEADGEVAGNVVSWEQDGRQLVGYWVGRDFWGRGLATAALAELVQELEMRPLHAWVARSNLGSVRVLEKCGFERIAETSEHDERIGQVVEMYLYELK